MQNRILISVVLFSLGPVLTAHARTLVEPPPPPVVQEEIAPSAGEVPAKPVTPPEPSRGQLLYEYHCTSCHESLVHIREHRSARTPDELRAQVVKWADYLHLQWSRDDVEEAVQYLDRRYYKFETR
jgi:cytochrome c5